MSVAVSSSEVNGIAAFFQVMLSDFEFHHLANSKDSGFL
jgi:hypothetical protein